MAKKDDKPPVLIRVKALRPLYDGVSTHATGEVFETTQDVIDAFGADLEEVK